MEPKRYHGVPNGARAIDIIANLDDLRASYNALTSIRKRDGWRSYETALQWLLARIEADEMADCAAEAERHLSAGRPTDGQGTFSDERVQ